jgi:hypothetical protein
MSPRAAWRLESLGFEQVYDYVPGKSDWLAAGLPREGEAAEVPLAGDLVRPIATCRLGTPLDQVKDRPCAVVNDQGIVLGLLRHPGDAPGTVDDHMEAGPTTVRASEEVAALLHRMQHARVAGILVTTPEGRPLGWLDREEAE